MSKQLLFFFLIRNCSKKTVCIKISFLKSSWTNRKFRGTKRKREGLCILRLFEINVFFFCKTDVFQPINNQFLFDCVCGVAKKLLLSVDSTFFKPSCWPPFTHTHTHRFCTKKPTWQNWCSCLFFNLSDEKNVSFSSGKGSGIFFCVSLFFVKFLS